MAKHLNNLEDFLPYQLSIASNAVSDLIAGEYKSRFGLKIPEWRVMAVLGNRKWATQRDLVAATRMDKVTVNRAVKALVDRKLLRRSPNNRDGRSHHLELSATGLELYGEIMPAARAMEERILAVLSDTERATLSALIRRIKNSADELTG
ncbi:MAG: MarR family winged helix-turn-helix transcriptional regulator [Parasphingorhabdus sp.]|nr:MarR family winged helix-turn-helix transcriptional regulator [Parasphingorhabdus sp.]